MPSPVREPKRGYAATRRGVLLGVVPLAALFAFPLSSCGGGGEVGSGPSPVMSPTVIQDGRFPIGSFDAALAAGDLCVLASLIPVTTSAFGDLDITVDWTVVTNNIDIVLVDGQCTCRDLRSARGPDELNGVCPLVAQSASETSKPERMISRGRAAGNYTLVVLNLGDQGDSCSYEVTLTPAR